MKWFDLRRIALTPTATFGVLVDDVDAAPFALTLERAWRNNLRGESCIPDGVYLCKRVQSPKFGDTFEITGVPGRAAILLHKGNLFMDSHGCVLVGEQFEPLNGQPGIAASRHGFEEFLRRTAGLAEFTLQVTTYGPSGPCVVAA